MMNNKKEVTPLRTRKGSIYQKGTNQTFKISRSKFSNFLDCKRCFYLDRVKGLKDPSMPGWSLNSAVDELLKKEFDEYRKKGGKKWEIFQTLKSAIMGEIEGVF